MITGCLDFQYEDDRLIKLLQYTTDGEICNYNNWDISYDDNIIMKGHYKNYSSGHYPEITYLNARDEFSFEDKKFVQKTTNSRSLNDEKGTDNAAIIWHDPTEFIFIWL